MPTETYVTNTQPGRDLITLQICIASFNDRWITTPGLLTAPPGLKTARLIVRAELDDVQPAA
jgi:sortase (surface protein transpeptidase)